MATGARYDDDVELWLGNDGDKRVVYDSVNQRLEIRDAADNVLMAVEDAGTTGNLHVTGDLTADGDISAEGHILRGANTPGVGVDGLVGYWRMDAATGPLVDYSGEEHDGTHAGSGTALAAGKFGNALSFNGSGNVTCGTALAGALGAGDFSLAAWIKSANAATQGLIGWYTAGDFAVMTLRTDGTVRLEINDGVTATTLACAQDLTDGEWHHVVGVRDLGGTSALYVDGALADSGADGGEDVSGAITFSLGALGASSSRLTGALDECAVWSRALPADEVAALYGMAAELPAGNSGFDGNLTGNLVATGDVTAQGGDVVAGVNDSQRGLFFARAGSTTTPGCVVLFASSADGIGSYLFADIDRKLRVKAGPPTSTSDGTLVSQALSDEYPDIARDCDITVTQGGSQDECDVTFQLKTATDANLNHQVSLDLWVDRSGVTVPDGGVSWTHGEAIQDYTANASWRVLTDSQGRVKITITDSAKAAQTVGVQLPIGHVVTESVASGDYFDIT